MAAQQFSRKVFASGPIVAALPQTGVLSMNDVVFRPSRQPRVTLPQAAGKHSGNPLLQDPAIILLVTLGISFVTLVLATGWLLIRG